MADFVYLLCVWAGSLNVFKPKRWRETPINLLGTTYIINVLFITYIVYIL